MTTIYMASEEALVVARKRGARWHATRKLEGLRPQCVAVDPRRPERVYCGTFGRGLMRSLDGGSTWEDRKPTGPYDAHNMAAHRLAPGRVYASAGDGFGRAGAGYAESRDGGETWERFGEGLRHHYLWGLAVDPANPDT